MICGLGSLVSAIIIGGVAAGVLLMRNNETTSSSSDSTTLPSNINQSFTSTVASTTLFGKLPS